MTTDSRILTIDKAAHAKVSTILTDTARDGDDIALVVAVAGLNGTEFKYQLHMSPVDLLDDDDHIEHHDGVTIAIPAASVQHLAGATLTMSRNLLNPGLSIDNPNSPSPAVQADAPPIDTSQPVAQQIVQVLEQSIGPALASHGGGIELVAIEDGIAYVRLGGGCQGCGMAQVTLSQGIEASIVASVPEIHKVIDVTDHGSGDNPYYEASKK